MDKEVLSVPIILPSTDIKRSDKEDDAGTLKYFKTKLEIIGYFEQLLDHHSKQSHDPSADSSK